VSFTTVTPVTETPVPATVTAVVEDNPVPVRVTGTVVPSTPVLGEMDVSVGAVTVNVTGLVVAPPAVILTLLAPVFANVPITRLAWTVVSLTTVRPVTETPVPVTVAPVAEDRPVPVNVTGTVVPSFPVFGEMDVRLGAVTVKVRALVVAPAAMAVRFLVVAGALAPITMLA